MWKKPRRPEHSVTQPYNSGVLDVYTVEDAAQPGRMPVETAREHKGHLPFEERSLGLQRYYQALENKVSINRVVRVPAALDINPQDIVVTNDGKEYHVVLVQKTVDIYPPSLDLTLSRITENYEMV